MEGKDLKKIILLICLFVLQVSSIRAQRDIFTIAAASSVGVVPFRLSGTMDVGNGNMTQLGNYIVTSEPVYKHIDSSMYIINIIVHFGLNISILRGENWDAGAKLNIGLGNQFATNGAEGLKSFLLDFPQYIYYRNFKSNLDFSVLAGYKYTYSVIPYQLLIAAFDFNIDLMNSIRLYGAFTKDRYYTLYTNGNIVPTITLTEFGIGYTIEF